MEKKNNWKAKRGMLNCYTWKHNVQERNMEF